MSKESTDSKEEKQSRKEKKAKKEKQKKAEKVHVLYQKLIGIVGPSRVSTERLERLLYSHDLASLPKEMEMGFKMVPDAVVRPRSAAEVSEIFKLAIEEGISVVPRGGGSWGLGGAVPIEGGIVLDLTNMNRILRVDPENMEIEVEAGATWDKIYDEALRRGLFIGSYPSSAPAATVAGWINTGGIGVGTYKYGSIGENIRNMEVVLPEGQIINTGFDYVSDHSAGYNLNAMFTGSEGTLGIITKVTIKAHPAPELIKPISVQFEKLGDAYPLMKAICRANITPLTMSFVDEYHLAYLKDMGKHIPGDGALLNITLEGSKAVVEYEESVIDGLIKEKGGNKLPDPDAAHEWEERFFEFRMRAVGISAALSEVVVPLNRFPQATHDIYEMIDSMKMEASVIGMIGDRNTIMFMPYFMYDEGQVVKSMASLSFTKKLGDIGIKNRGRPLGFGLFFAGNLGKVRGIGADVMFDIKSVLDPHDVLNPGKMLEGMTRFGIPIPGFGMDLGMNVMAIGKKVLTKDKAFSKNVVGYNEDQEKHHKHMEKLIEENKAKRIERAVQVFEAHAPVSEPALKPVPPPVSKPEPEQVEVSAPAVEEPSVEETVAEAAEEARKAADKNLGTPDLSAGIADGGGDLLDDLDADGLHEIELEAHEPDHPDDETQCPTCNAKIKVGDPKCKACEEELIWE
jgi:glycolate oxidase